MAKLTWDQVGERVFETGVDHGVLYTRDGSGAYATAHSWNGLTTVTEAPSGAEASPQYADNIKYLNLVSAEEYGATIEAFTYPEAFAECDGTAMPTSGVSIGQQSRKTFGFGYRTRVGNDIDGTDHGYKLHLIYGALAAPSEKAYGTINDSPEATPFSWEVTTTPAEVGTVGGVEYKPTASLTIDSTKVDAAALASLEEVLYGTTGVDGRLPLPSEVLAFFDGTVTEVSPTTPGYDDVTGVITIPSVTGVVYKINGVVQTSGAKPAITVDTFVTAEPAKGYKFAPNVDNDWLFEAP